MDADRAFWLFAIFAAVIFLTGGGSRYDIESVGPLRAFSATVFAYALFFQSEKSLRRVAMPLVALLALGVWMVIQLIPLPPSLWTALPGREAIAGLGELAGLSDVWRPITFSPMKTANSLASLIVPLTALVVLALLDDKGWRRVPWIFICAGVASAIFGLAQVLFPAANGLFLYEITNDGSAVGLFSNRNHNAMFLTVALLFCVVRMERFSRRSFGAADLAAICGAIIIFACLLVNPSRAGLVGVGLVGLIYAVRALLHWRKSTRDKTGTGSMRLVAGAVVGLFSFGLVGLFAALGRSQAVERLLAQDPAEELRVQSLPWLLDMVKDFQPFGVGFGAFEQAFRTIEPAQLLGPRYLNHAHNDWLQFPIEGGVPAILIGLVVIAMLVMRTLRISRIKTGSSQMLENAWQGILVLGILALVSIVDYPLRTPSLMMVAAAAAAMMFKPMATGAKG